MDIFTAKPRPLPWNLRESAVIESTTPDDGAPSGVFSWPEDGNEKTLVLFELSLNEYNALSTAIDVGRDIAFGDDSVRLWWLWIRNMVQVPQICEMMIDCIMNNEATRDAIIDAVLGSDEFQQTIKNQSGAGGPLSDGNISAPLTTGDCENDVLFGQASAIVEAMHNGNVDLLQRVEVATNPAERVALLIASVPLIETLPLNEGAQLVDKLLEELFENYEGAMTTALMDEIRCDIFCMALEDPDCYIDFGDLYDYFADKLGGSVNIATLFAEGMTYIATGAWVGSQVVYAMMLFQVCVWRWGSKYLGLTLLSLATVAQNADPDPDWETLCDCVVPEGCVDLEETDGGFVGVAGGWAQWTPDVGWGQDGTQPYVQISKGVGSDQITSVRVHFLREWAASTVNPDYDKFYIIVAGGAGSTAPTITLPGAPAFLTTGQEITVPTPEGQYWATSVTISVIAGGNTWPGSGGNPASPQYIDEVCLFT